MTLIANIDTRRIGMNNLQPGIRRPQTSSKFFFRISDLLLRLIPFALFSPDLQIGMRFGPVTNG